MFETIKSQKQIILLKFSTFKMKSLTFNLIYLNIILSLEQQQQKK